MLNLIKILFGLGISTSFLSTNVVANRANTTIFTNFDTKEESLEAGNKLNEDILKEGITLLKNEDNALPIAKGSKVSVFGKYSTNLFYNGAGSGAGSTGTQPVKLEDVLKNAGLEVNPQLTSFYSNDSLSGKLPTQLTSYKNNAGYNVGETSVDKLKSNVSEDSYNQYGDAAFIVISRKGMESADLPKSMSTGFNSDGSIKDSKISGARDKNDHSLQPTQTEADLIKYVSSKFEKVVLLLNTGSQFECGFLDDPGHYAYSDKIKAALWFGFPGFGSGINSLGKVITGEINPSGHTVDTYARDFKLDPTFHNMALYNDNAFKYSKKFYDGKDRWFVNYKEDIYVGYKYYETRGNVEGEKPYSTAINGGNLLSNTTTTEWDNWYDSAVVYPFGHGLSYTTFEWTINSKTDESAPLTKDSKVTIEVSVKNTGNYSGKDVVQLYLNPPYTAGEIAKSTANLIGFEKTKLLKPGESQVLSFDIDTKDLESYDYNDANKNGHIGYEVEAGNYEINISKNAHDSIHKLNYKVEEDIYFDESSTGQKIENLFSDAELKDTTYLSRDDFENTMPKIPTDEERNPSDEILEGVKATSNSTEIINNDDPTDPWYSEEMPKTGNNTGTLKLEDLRGLEIDDPKYLEYVQQFAIGDKTNTGMVETIWNAGWSIHGFKDLGLPTTNQEDGPSGLAGRYVTGVYTNFASETVLASTWNKDLAYKKGIIIGNQGLFGSGALSVHGIYAPSINLHRSAFGGRNFEYYSEDAFLTGHMAGHIIKGCNEKGMITYLKHFAINEHETKRENLLTFANEQTMRELYLKAFQICVEEYETHGIMSALNSLGTTWTGGNYALLTKLLREEWGFKGIVITDYVQSRAQLNGNQCIRAGGDILLARAGSQQTPAGLDKPSTVKSLQRAMINIAYSTLNFTAAFNTENKNILGEYEGGSLTPALAGIEYKGSVANALTNDGSNPKEVVKYSLKEGETLPEGLTLNEDGSITGIAEPIYQSKTFTVEAKYDHSVKEATFTLPVIDKNNSVVYIKPTDANIKTGYVGESYEQNVAWAYLPSEESKNDKIVYCLARQSLLPNGLTLSEDGVISGIPTNAVTNYLITIEAKSGDKYPMSLQIELNIGNRINDKEIKLANARVNQKYSQSIKLNNNKLVYKLVENSVLPEGLNLTTDGIIEGTPVVAANNLKFQVEISGENYISIIKEYALTVKIDYSSFNLDSIKVGNEVNINVNFAQGATNIKYSLIEGQLPKGLSLSEDGIISGKALEYGSFGLTLKATSGDLTSDIVKTTLYVEAADTNNNYYIGLGIGIGAIVLTGALIVIYFIFFDPKNKIKKDTNGNNNESQNESKDNKDKKAKINVKGLSISLGALLVVGATLITSMTLLSPAGAGFSKLQSYTFEAEYTYLDDFAGAGISNSADGVNNIYGEGSDKDKEKGWSNGYFLGNTYAANVVTFEFESSSNASGKLVLRLGSELGNLSLNNSNFEIKLNDELIDYSIVVQNSRTGEYDFDDYAIKTAIKLLEGENVLTLTILDNTLQGGNRTGAPLIDCIKITTESELTWNPLLDNPDRRGEI